MNISDFWAFLNQGGGLQNASDITGLDPSVIAGQAAWESGYGAHAPGNNFFGIKGVGDAGSQMLWTTEYIPGQGNVRVQAPFAAYSSPAAGLAGYASFITDNPRYQGAEDATTVSGQISALGAAGYATDPNYVGNITSTAAKFSGMNTAQGAVAQTAGSFSAGLGELLNNPGGFLGDLGGIISGGAGAIASNPTGALAGLGATMGGGAGAIAGAAGGILQPLVDWLNATETRFTTWEAKTFPNFVERSAVGIVALALIVAGIFFLAGGPKIIEKVGPAIA